MITSAGSAQVGGTAGPIVGRATDTPGDPGVFRSVLGRAVGGGDARERVRAAAEELVSIALIQPILAELRSSKDAAPPFAPGPYEKQFGSLMDAEISRRLVKAQNFPLVDRLARDLLRMSETTEGPRDESAETDGEGEHDDVAERA